MNFGELKERIVSFWNMQWQQFQETSSYQQLKEKYDDLSPLLQLVVKVSVCLIFVFVALSIPMSTNNLANEAMMDFESHRQLLKDVLKIGRQLQETPDLIPQLKASEIKTQVENVIGQFQLMPEQVKPVEEKVMTLPAGQKMVSSRLSLEGVALRLDRLNIRQVVEFEFRLQSLKTQGIHIISSTITRTAADSHYYDLDLEIAGFSTQSVARTPSAVAGL